MNKLANAADRSRKLSQFLRILSNLPGLGFIAPIADKLNAASQSVEQARGKVAMQLDDVGDAQDAWEDFKHK